MCKAFEELIEQGALMAKVDDVKNIMVKYNASLEEAIDVVAHSERERQYILENFNK